MEIKTRPPVSADDVMQARSDIAEALQRSPIPSPELIRNLGVYLLPMELKRFLFFDSLYRQTLSVSGVIVEFGCRWGQNVSILQNLRAIYEPYNYFRKIIAFDTFAGFTGVTAKDPAEDFAAEGAYAVVDGYEKHLERLLRLKEVQSPLSHMQKFELVKGDAPVMFQEYLERHPETIVSLAYFDMDLYKPTLECLKLLKRHLTKGSIVGFDELNMPEWSGETVAFQEAIGANNVRLQRNTLCHTESFYVVE